MAKTKAKSKSVFKAKPKTKAQVKSKPAKKAAVKAKAKPAAKAKAKPKTKSAAKPTKKLAGKAKTSKTAKAAAVVAVGVALGAAALGAKVAQGKSASKSSGKPANSSKTNSENLSSLFSPLDDRLVIEAIELATRTAGGLFIPDTVDGSDRPRQGKVLAVGRGHQGKKGRIRPLDVQLGDTVLFESYMASPITIGTREVVLIRESQILGIVKV